VARNDAMPQDFIAVKKKHKLKKRWIHTRRFSKHLSVNFEISLEKVVRKYCRRWLVEKGIAEQIEVYSSRFSRILGSGFNMKICVHFKLS
jgi:hypothetical protein